MRARSAVAGIAAALVAAALAGCGAGAGPDSAGVSLTVTRDFGTRHIAALTATRVPGSDTIMELLQRRFRVGTRYGGDFVESIDGRSGSSSHLDWFYYVDGMQAPEGAGTTAVDRGDRIWWDLHDWTETDSIPAVVGSYPAPFVDGPTERRSVTTLECAAAAQSACATVARSLRGIGARVVTRALPSAGGYSARGVAILVGTFSELARMSAARLVGGGPKPSGVYARVAGAGRRLLLLDPHGQVMRTLGGSAGLVAATAVGGGGSPTWVIGGTDLDGVSAAAAALSARRLDDHFALAVAGGRSLPLPLEPAS